MKRSSWIAIAAVVLVVAAGVWWKSRARGDAPRYRTAAVERGPIRSVVSATGTILPVVQVEVGSQVSGTVNKLYADYNSRVTEGQLLCQLEPSSFRARAAQAEAAVARAEAALKEAQRQHRRSRELVRENYVSQADVEAAEVEVELREADLKQARAQLQAAAVDLGNTTIRAPIDGVVIARSIAVGQTVAASLQAPKLFVIANDLSQMQVETRIDEADIGRITPGLPVTFTVDAYPDLEFQGNVTQVRLEPIIEQGVVTYTTVIRTQNRDLKLRPGMTANVSLLVAMKDDVMKVPSAALRFKPAVEKSGTRGGAMAGPGAPMRPGGASAATREGGSGAGVRGAGAGRAMREGDASAATREGGSGAGDAPQVRPGAVYVLRDGKPARVPVMTGLGDGASFEIESDGLKPGDSVIVGLEITAQNRNLQPPPGMGGPQFRGPGGRSGRGR